MSDKLDKSLKDLGSHADKIFGKKADDFEFFVELSKALKSKTDLLEIARNRFFAMSIKNLDVPKNHLLRTFREFERKMTKEVHASNRKSGAAAKSYVNERCELYFHLVGSSEEIGNQRITDTFMWSERNQERRRKEIVNLFKALRGLNSRHVMFLSDQTSQDEFMSLLSLGSIHERIIWSKPKNQFIYFIDKLAEHYFVLPDYLEDRVANSEDYKKGLMDWLNPKIISCFSDSAGKPFKAKPLTSSRSKLDLSKLKNKDILDEILNSCAS